METENTAAEEASETVNGDSAAAKPAQVIKASTSSSRSIGDKCELFEEYPYIVKVKYMPLKYEFEEFISYIENQFKLKIDKITQPEENSPYVLIHCATEDESNLFTMALDSHTWNKHPILAVQFEHPSLKKKSIKPKTADDTVGMIIHYNNISYEEQCKIQEIRFKSMCNLLHADICFVYKDLIPWAESSVQKNNGFLLDIQPLVRYPDPKLKHIWSELNIGKNQKGEISVGYVSKIKGLKGFILSIYPGDNMIHLSDPLKLVAQKLEEYLRANPREPFCKHKTTGYWHKMFIRETPNGSFSLLVFVFKSKQIKPEESQKVKEEMKAFFQNGPGKETNVSSLAIQVFEEYGLNPKLSEPADVLFGEESAVEEISGLKFNLSPAKTLNVYRRETCDAIRDAVVELGEINKDKNVFVLGYGTGGINVSLAPHCNYLAAYEEIPTYSSFTKKSHELNNITNAEVVNKIKSDELDVKDILDKLGSEKEIVVVLDNLRPQATFKPPILGFLRERNNIKRIVYLFLIPSFSSNLPIGIKDLTATSPKKGTDFAGHPFLPTTCRGVDSSPFRRDKVMVMAFDRIDPSGFPPATFPAPVPNLTRKTQKSNPFRSSGAAKRKRAKEKEILERGKYPRKFMRMGEHGPPGRLPLGQGFGRRPPPNWGGPPAPIPPPYSLMARREEELILKLENRIAQLESRQMNLNSYGGSGGGGDIDTSINRRMGNFGGGVNRRMDNYGGVGGVDRRMDNYGGGVDRRMDNYGGGVDRRIDNYGGGGVDRRMDNYGRWGNEFNPTGPPGRGGVGVNETWSDDSTWNDWNQPNYYNNGGGPPLPQRRGGRGGGFFPRR